MKLAVRIAGMGAGFASGLARLSDVARTRSRPQSTVSDPQDLTPTGQHVPSAVADTMVQKQE